MLPIAAGNIRRGPTTMIAHGLHAGKSAATTTLRNPRVHLSKGQCRLLSLADNNSHQKEPPQPKQRGFNKPRERKSVFAGPFNISKKQKPTSNKTQKKGNQKVKAIENVNKQSGGVGAKNKTYAPVVGIQKEIQALNQIAANLSPKSPFVSTALTNDHDSSDEQKDLFHRTRALVDALKKAVSKGDINPSGRHGRTVSAVLGNILKFYSLCQEKQSAFQECQSVLSMLDEWNLDRLEPHYQYSILAAVHEQQWREASSLFLQQIDRNVSGFCPVTISVSFPVGLYALARTAQDNQTPPTELVLEAVSSLSQISPTEQEQHILAAGTALGLAGECDGLVSYLEENSNDTSFGQALVAATMHACILCNQHDQALDAFRTLVEGKLPSFPNSIREAKKTRYHHFVEI